MSQTNTLNKLFVSADNELSPQQLKQVQLYNMLLRSILARSKAGQDWLHGIEYDVLMELFVALQRTRVYQEAEQDRERQLQALINHRLRGSELATIRGNRSYGEMMMTRSQRAVSLDEQRDFRGEEASPAFTLGQREEYRTLEQAVCLLKAREQDAVRLYMDGANFTQVGQSLGVSDVFARKLLKQAFAKLRELLEEMNS